MSDPTIIEIIKNAVPVPEWDHSYTYTFRLIAHLSDAEEIVISRNGQPEWMPADTNPGSLISRQAKPWVRYDAAYIRGAWHLAPSQRFSEVVK